MSEVVIITKMAHHIDGMKSAVAESGMDIPCFYEPTNERCLERAKAEVANGAKILIASDFLASYFAGNINVKIIPIIRTTFSIVKFIKSTMESEDNVVLICNPNGGSFTRALEQAARFVSGTRMIYASNTRELDALLTELKTTGVTAVVSPVWMAGTVEKHGMKSILIPFVKEDFMNALHHAVYELMLMGEQKRFGGMLDMMMNLVTVGIVSINSDGTIGSINKLAKDLFHLTDEIIGQPCKDTALSPIMVLKPSPDGTGLTSDIVSVSDVAVLANSMPLIVDGELKMSVVTLSPLDQIIENEQKIRKSYKHTGNYATKTFASIIGNSAEIKRVIQQAKRYASVDSTVLICGPSGSGKEVFAQSIHNASQRRNEPFVVINCAALPESLIESILFGYEKGAFTGARSDGQKGLFEIADNGTVFLDEISEMPLSTQARFLRVLQEREIMRVGSTKAIPVNVRVLAATNRNLRELVGKNMFREDLYYRISVLVLELPSLAQRPSDIPLLAKYFVKTRSEELNFKSMRFTQTALDHLARQDFGGNIRELSNIVERSIVLSPTSEISLETVCAALGERPGENEQPGQELPLGEAQDIMRILKKYYGDRRLAAKELGISTTTLWRRMKKYGIEYTN